MQRGGNSGRVADLEEGQMSMTEHHIENPNHHEQQNKKAPTLVKKCTSKSRSTTTGFPVFLSFSLRFTSPDKCLHLLPLLVLLSIFFLWWFSNPVNLMSKDGRMTSVHSIERPPFVNETEAIFDLGRLTILAVSSSPNPSVELTLTKTDKST